MRTTAPANVCGSGKLSDMKISVHPLFVAFGLYYAAVGRVFEFAAFTITAVIHETGHSAVAGNLGYRLDKMVLMPFGAVAKGDIDGLKLKDEIKIALAGPFLNLAVGLAFAAVWWIFPETYAFTDVAAYANFTMALVNFIPCYPLDGGRVLSAVISLKAGRKRAHKICKTLGVALSCLLLAGFIATLFKTPNFSLLFFAAFAFAGAISKEKDTVYVKIGGGLSERKLLRGMPVVKQAVSKNITVKSLASVLDCNAVNEIDVYDGEKKIVTLSQNELSEILQTAEIYEKIDKYF